LPSAKEQRAGGRAQAQHNEIASDPSRYGFDGVMESEP